MNNLRKWRMPNTCSDLQLDFDHLAAIHKTEGGNGGCFTVIWKRSGDFGDSKPQSGRAPSTESKVRVPLQGCLLYIFPQCMFVWNLGYKLWLKQWVVFLPRFCARSMQLSLVADIYSSSSNSCSLSQKMLTQWTHFLVLLAAWNYLGIIPQHFWGIFF